MTAVGVRPHPGPGGLAQRPPCQQDPARRVEQIARKAQVQQCFAVMHRRLGCGPDRLVDSGQLHRVTDQVFPFEQIADAFAYLEQGHAKGKVVVRL